MTLKSELSNVSRETMERLRLLEDLVAKWTPRINLISKRDRATIWDRHIADSAQIWQFSPEKPETWADFGSGGGFPGLVIGAFAADENPRLQLTLVESDQRKAAFLRQAVREMDIRCQVLAKRIEDVQPLAADVISARALASLPKLLEYLQLHGKESCVGIFPKGRRSNEEIEEARRDYRFKVTATPSITDEEAAILQISEVARA